MAGDRTEKPTPKRLKDAREKGQVARTREAAQAASLLAPVLVLAWAGGPFMQRLGALTADGIRRAGDLSTTALQPADLTGLAHETLAAAGLLVGPLALGAMLLVVASFLVQGGATLATKAVEVKWEKLNPANGFKRFGLSHGGLELLRSSLAVTLISVVGYQLVIGYVEASPELARLAPLDAAARMWEASSTLIVYAGLGLLLLAAAD
jgi:flagellar biosynthesis protein FlhB